MAAYRYNRREEPPAPFLDILVSASESSEPVALSAQLDTGADTTHIPISLLRELEIAASDTGLIRGVSGPATAQEIFKVFISIEQGIPEQYEVFSWNWPYALLGRDILNKYHLTLDGPNLTFTLSR